MKIAIIGSMGRETVLVERLLSEKNLVYVLTNQMNSLLKTLNCQVQVSLVLCPVEIEDFILEIRPDLVFVMQEKLIYQGLADLLCKHHIKCCFPSEQNIFLEMDKIETKNLVRSLFPQLVKPSNTFRDYDTFFSYCSTKGKVILRIKKEQEFITKMICLNDILSNIEFKEMDYGGVWVDDYIEGFDVSITALSDGENLVFFPPIYDFPNIISKEKFIKTGGMGAITLSERERKLPFFLEKRCRELMRGVLHYLFTSGFIYQGFIVGQFRVTLTDIYFIEFDIRPGEPEFINLIHSLKSSFTDTILIPFINQKLRQHDLEFFTNQSSLSLCIAPQGYPDHAVKDERIDLNIKNENECKIYWSGAYLDQEKALRSNGRRICTIFSHSRTIHNAANNILNYIMINKISRDRFVFLQIEELINSISMSSSDQIAAIREKL